MWRLTLLHLHSLLLKIQFCVQLKVSAFFQHTKTEARNDGNSSSLWYRVATVSLCNTAMHHLSIWTTVPVLNTDFLGKVKANYFTNPVCHLGGVFCWCSVIMLDCKSQIWFCMSLGRLHRLADLYTNTLFSVSLRQQHAYYCTWSSKCFLKLFCTFLWACNCQRVARLLDFSFPSKSYHKDERASDPTQRQTFIEITESYSGIIHRVQEGCTFNFIHALGCSFLFTKCPKRLGPDCLEALSSFTPCCIAQWWC